MPSIDKYLDCASRGLTPMEAAAELGVSHQAVRQFAEIHKLQFSDRGKKDIGGREKVIESHNKGLTPFEITAKTGYGCSTVRRWLDEADKIPNRKIKADDVERLLKQGIPQVNVAIKTGISSQRVWEVKVRRKITNYQKSARRDWIPVRIFRVRFDSLSSAARTHKVTVATVKSRCQSPNFPNWTFDTQNSEAPAR